MEGDEKYPNHFESTSEISIHSLRMEGDRLIHAVGNESLISIHSLRMEGDEYQKNNKAMIDLFQSTPSAWRETFAVHEGVFECLFQSTPSAWRETRSECFAAYS